MLRHCLPALFATGLALGDTTLSLAPPEARQENHLTLDQAIEQVAQLRAGGDRSPVTLNLYPGFYPASLDLDADLVGEGLHFISRGAKANPAKFTAGTPIAKWTVDGDLWSAPLAEEPAALFDTSRSEMFMNGKSRPRARTPNEGYWRIEKTGPDRRTSFTWQETTIRPVKDLAHLDLVFLHDWSITRVAVKSLDDKTRTLTTKVAIGPTADHYRIDHYEKQPRFFLEGSRDFLDAPGEWHYDRVAKRLFYKPRPGEKPDQLFYAATAPHVVRLRGAPGKPIKNVAFEGVEFSHANWHSPGERYAAGQATFHEDGTSHTRTPVPASVEATHCKDLRFEGCFFTCSATGGLWIGEGCEDVTIKTCRFRDLHGNGLMIGQPETPKHVCRNVTVEGCLVTECGTRFHGAVGIWIGMTADCVVRKCLIHDLPYTGLSVGWRWNPTPSACKGHLIENNHIHDIMNILSDGGGIYTLGRQPGTILRGNHIHDVSVNAGRAESNGIFMDQGTTDILVENNHIHDIARSPIRFHQAGKNLLRKNKLEPKEGVPALRFNNTPEENIVVE